MRIGHRYLTWNSHSKIIKPLRTILDRYNISYRYKENLDSVIPTSRYTLEFHLYEDNPVFASIKGEVEKCGIEPQIATYYEKGDITNADWFSVSTGEYQYPQPE